MSATWTRTALCAARGAAQKIRPGAGMSPAQVAMPLQGSMEARRLFSAKVWPREDDKVWQAIPAHGSCSMADAEPAVKNQAGNICTPCETSCGVMLPPDLSCWSCQKARPSARCADNLFCGNCGSVQPPAPKCNYFELIGISEEKFDLNLKELEQKYKALVRKLHPDQFMQHGTRPIEFSEAQTSVVNVAYSTLRCPFKRAEYMLRRMGVNFEEETSSADSEFMMEAEEHLLQILEASSRIEDAARNQEELKSVRDEFYLPNLTACGQEFEGAYRSGDIARAAQATARLMYLKRVKEQLQDQVEVQ